MTRLSIRTRVAATAALLAFVVLVGVGLIVYGQLRDTLRRQAQTQARSEAARLARLVDTGGGEQQGTAVDLTDPSLTSQLARPEGFTVVVDGRGRVVQSSEPHSALPSGLAASCLRAGSSTGVEGGQTLACARVGTAQRPAGAVIAGVSLVPAGRTLARMRGVLAASLLGASLLVLALAWLATGRALRPLAQIAAAARDIGRGARGRRIAYGGPRDDVGALAEELDRSFERLDRAIAEQARFLADASHELRSPLAAARSHVQLLRGWAAADPAARAQALDALHRSISRMTRLVDDLLHVAHGEAGPAYARSPVSLDDVLVELHHEARSLAPEVRVLLRLNDQATVVGDRDKLHQLVRNLLDNALRHTPPGGEVRLELRRVDDTAEVIVADTGRGIAAAQLPHVFERRYQGGPEERSGGAGLGLSIALEIARAHGGSIAVDSREGHGTSVRVTLPIAPAEVSSDRYPPLTSASPEPPSLKVPR